MNLPARTLLLEYKPVDNQLIAYGNQGKIINRCSCDERVAHQLRYSLVGWLLSCLRYDLVNSLNFVPFECVFCFFQNWLQLLLSFDFATLLVRVCTLATEAYERQLSQCGKKNNGDYFFFSSHTFIHWAVPVVLWPCCGLSVFVLFHKFYSWTLN